MSDKKLQWVRSIYGDSTNGKQWHSFIPSGGVNDLLASWHSKQEERGYNICSPSKLYICPRVVWLATHGVPSTKKMGWGKRQRLLLGKAIENLIAQQMDDEGVLLYHWKDDFDLAGDSTLISEEPYIEGTPDILFNMDGVVTLSDSKSARSDGMGYQPTTFEEWVKDPYNYKYFVQINAYYYLMHVNRTLLEDMMPMPEQCHVFVFALDDGIVRRDFTWKPTRENLLEVERLAEQYAKALASPVMPPCKCKQMGLVKFCDYGTGGKVVATDCCSDNLINQVKE